MDTNTNIDQNLEKKENVILDRVVPTLFIGVGGTGAEILLRIRRRILNNLWGSEEKPFRLDKISDFPFASFLHIDLDSKDMTESGKSTATDILGSKVKFEEQERIVEKLDISNYTRTESDLAKNLHIQEWFPLDRKTINGLNIDVEKGAGQIRSISRLYVYDKSDRIKRLIHSKCVNLLSNVSSESKQKRLGLATYPNRLKIFVIASTAGGTGSGAFIDLGYLAGWQGKEAATEGVSTNLCLFLPTGYSGANKSRTEANTYAALMELETSMQEGGRYVKQWNKDEIPKLKEKPYDDIYFIDTVNLAGQRTQDINDLNEMVADILFEDFSTAAFANQKRSIAANQNQHKTLPYEVELPEEDIFGDMKITYSRGNSGFGQAIIDTHQEQHRNILLLQQVNEMLRSFFGIAQKDIKSNIPTEGERDELIINKIYLEGNVEVIEYDLINSTHEFRQGAEVSIYRIAKELLLVNQKSRLDDIESGIDNHFENIRTSGDYKEWYKKIQEVLKLINSDTYGGFGGKALYTTTINKQRNEIKSELLNTELEGGLIKSLWARVDNKERGGLDYTIELIKSIKDRIDNPNNGIVKHLIDNSKWFAELSGHLRNKEFSTLQEHLQQAIGKFISAQQQSEAKLKQICNAVKLYVRYHLLATACKEAAELLKEISDELGKQKGVDDDGNPIWGGFLGELEIGRELVKNIISESNEQIKLTEIAMNQKHSMYLVLPAKNIYDKVQLPTPEEAHTWAEEAFVDFGGTQELFAILRNEEQKSELLNKLRNRAVSQIQAGVDVYEENPIFAALVEKERKGELGQLFEDFLSRSMPWLSSDLKYLKKNNPNDQYKCVIAVKDSKKFEETYKDELLKRLPTITKMSVEEVGFHEIDTPGKIICYVELSGIPIPSLRSINNWYTSYKQEKIPVHTHRDISKLVRARELDPDEIKSRMEDFKLFVQAIALGNLSRLNQRYDDGIYTFRNKGKDTKIGDEKVIRLFGLPSSWKSNIEWLVSEDINKLTNTSQLSIWIALLQYYTSCIYPKKSFEDANKSTQYRTSFPTIVCQKLSEEYEKRLVNQIGEEESIRLINEADMILKNWVNEIDGSTKDVYEYEVEKNELKPKVALKREALDENWSWKESVAVKKQEKNTSTTNTPPKLISFYVAKNGKQTGPFDIDGLSEMIANGSLTKDTKVWCNGMEKWEEASTVDELKDIFQTPPPLEDEATPPPIN